jgi:hypothetical protein
MQNQLLKEIKFYIVNVLLLSNLSEEKSIKLFSISKRIGRLIEKYDELLK